VQLSGTRLLTDKILKYLRIPPNGPALFGGVELATELDIKLELVGTDEHEEEGRSPLFCAGGWLEGGSVPCF
jgi:hypothetical protein